MRELCQEMEENAPMAQPAGLEKGSSQALLGSGPQSCWPENVLEAKEKAKHLLLRVSETEETLESLGENKLGLKQLRSKTPG